MMSRRPQPVHWRLLPKLSSLRSHRNCLAWLSQFRIYLARCNCVDIVHSRTHPPFTAWQTRSPGSLECLKSRMHSRLPRARDSMDGICSAQSGVWYTSLWLIQKLPRNFCICPFLHASTFASTVPWLASGLDYLGPAPTRLEVVIAYF